MNQPTLYNCLMYQQPYIAQLATLLPANTPTITQVGSNTLPFAAQAIQQVQSTKGAVFYDFENLYASNVAALNDSTISNLEKAFIQGKTAENDLGFYTTSGDFNPWTQTDDKPGIGLALLLRERGLFTYIDWYGLDWYYAGTQGATPIPSNPYARNEELVPEILLLNKIAAAKESGKPIRVFMCPRCTSQDAAAGMPVDLGYWTAQWRLLRCLVDLGEIQAGILWDYQDPAKPLPFAQITPHIQAAVKLMS